ncbi:protein CsbA [Abyssicoccus albus]|uniref:General stress protein CsbA n=2 Tax=Abyssicoccus albus TaxID=1817405 RepID=A0A1Q1G2V8_9BACL|nr:DUF2198 family protein [Abyssicoccus albus]AQL56698.1 protein CsbA [Abyssicoccus albus]RPF57482.1 general stress protein CsbA [Abyssicoccus albus]
MIGWYMMAMVMPMTLVIFFSVVARNKFIGSTLALILIGVSVYKDFFHSEWILFLDACSLVIGMYIVDTLNLDDNGMD